jgi:prepilin-type processing-associated H-X9-DG protein
MAIDSGLGVGVTVFDSEEQIICSSGTTLSTGWHNAVWTYNAGANILYMDGNSALGCTLSSLVSTGPL